MTPNEIGWARTVEKPIYLREDLHQMAKKKQFVTAAAAFAVAASAVAPAITADAASTTVRLSSDYVRGGDLNAALDKEYKGSEIHWYKSSIDMNKLGVFQTAKGFVKGKGIKVEKKLRVLNYAQEIKPESEFVFEQGVPVSGIRVQPVLFADGVVYNKPLFVAGFSTEKVGEFEGTLTYSNKAYGSVTKTVKYKVVASKVEFSEVKHEVKDDMLSVSADVKNLKEGEKVELVIFPGKDESKPLDPYTAEIKDGKVTVSAKDIPAGTHSFILRSGDVKTAAMEFKVEDQTPMVKEVKALNLKQVEVKFNKDLDKASAETVTNYELKIGSDAATNPTAAEVTSEGTVLLTFAAKGQSTDAKLTVKNVKTAKNIVVAETTKEVRFLDVVAPTVGEISIVAPRIIRVNFSEPLASAPTFKLNNGQTAIVSTSWSAGQDYADLTIGIDPENGSSHSLEISGGADYAGFKIDAVTKSFVYQTDATAPKAMISKVVDNNTIEVKLDKEINASTVTGNLEFYHTVKGASGYKATSVQLKNGSTDTLVVDFPVVFPEGQVKFFLGYADDKGTLVQDKWGNKLAATELSAVYAADTVAPTLVSVEGKTKRTIEVKFNEAVTEASAELAGNIVLTDADNKVVAQSAALGEDGKTVTLTATADLAGGNYKVTVKNVVDASNNKIAEVSRTFYVNDMVAPTVNGTADLLAGNKKVKIKFSEAMNAASITDKSKYKLGTADLDSKVTITAVDGNKAVILDFSATNETSLANAEITVGRVADATGNLTADFSNLVTVASAQSTVAATKAEVTGKRSVKLYFDEVITGAVAGDFVVYNDTTPVTVSNLVNSIEAGKSVLTLTVSSDLPFDAEDITVDSVGTTSAKNNDGLLVNFADLEASDKYAPEISTAVFTNGGTADAQDSLVLTFSEALYAPSVQDSDFTVAGRVVEAISVNGAAGTVTLMLKEDGSATSAKPASVSIVNMVEDAARNAKSSQVFTAITPE